ncbi:MAG TPA: hypothetical protein VK671_08685 [Mucilaginibacter sp.]|nr:hypothetical protein [Mucilaginibacter sp.]
MVKVTSSSDKTVRYLYYGILFVLFCHFIALIFAQYYMKVNADSAESGWYSKLAFVSDIVLTPISLFLYFKYHRYFPFVINTCFILMPVLVFISSFNDLGLFVQTPSVFYSPKGLGTWLNFGILYFAVEEDYTEKLLKWFKYFCYALVAFNLVQLAMAGSISNRDVALNAIRDTTVVLLWVYPFFFLDTDDKTNIAKLTKYGVMLLITFFVFAIASRSYLLTMAIIIFIKLRRDLKEGKSTFILICMILMGVMAGYYVVVNIDKFGTLKDISTVFSGRMGEDSRSSQLKEFMDQFNWDKLFTGVGPAATWNWSGDLKAPYQWLDNQFILIIWWFGLQTCVPYLGHLVYSFSKRNPLNLIRVTNSKIILFFWTLACAGFGIYVTISSSVYYYFMTLMIGIVTVNVRRVIVYQVQSDPEVKLLKNIDLR